MAGMFVPQMVTPVDTSFLRDIGNTIGGLKQDSEIADILKGIDPYDPNSKQRVINDLRQHSREGRDMADRMEGLEIRRQTATQQGEYQQGQLGISGRNAAVNEGNLTLAQQKAAREQANEGSFTKMMEDYRKGGGGLAGIPSTSAVPTAPGAAAPAPKAAAPVGAAPGETNYWDDATEEEGGPPRRPAAPTRATPIIRAPQAAAPSAAPEGAGPVARGFVAEPVSGAPGVQRAGAFLGQQPVPPPTPAPIGRQPPIAPQRLIPSLAGPLAGAATRAVLPSPVTPAAAEAPVRAAAAEPDEEPVVEEPPAAAARAVRAAAGPDLTPRQIQLRNDNRFLAQMMSHPAATPTRIRGIQAQIAENDAEFAGIEAERTKGSKGEEAREKAESQADTKAKFELAKEVNAKMKRNVDLRDSLKAMERTVSSPNYPSGVTAKPYMYLGGLAIEANRIMKNITGKGFEEGFKDAAGQHIDGEGWYDRWVQDPTSRLRMAQKLANTITLQMLGGTLARDVSNADRDFVKRINAAVGDDPESVKRLIATQLAYMDREDAMQALVGQGIQGKKTTAQIHARMRRYGQENPLFEGTAASEKIGGPKEGEPTALSQRIDPDNARKYYAKQKAERELAAKTREEFRDPGEGAVAGGRPTREQVRATERFDAAVREVPGREVTGAGSSRAPTDRAASLERTAADAELAREGAGQRVRDVAREVTEAPEVRPGVEAARTVGEAARNAARAASESRFGNWMRELGPIGPNRGNAPGVMPRGAAVPNYYGPGGPEFERSETPPYELRQVAPAQPPRGISAPQRAERTNPFSENDDIRGIVEQGPRLAPGGIPWEAYRRSTNVENRPEPNETPTPLTEQWRLANNYMSGREHLPAGPLSWQAGLADLSSMEPGMRARMEERQMRELLGDRMYEQTKGGTRMPAPIPLPPLPRPKPRRKEERR